MKKILLLIIILLWPVLAYSENIGGLGIIGFVPEVVLLAPAQEIVDLTGKENLEFKWSPHEGTTTGVRQYYDFRLYKGYDSVQANLILKQQVDPDTFQLNLKADTFENNQVYTWSLRQVYISEKSKPSYYSFKVIRNKR